MYDTTYKIALILAAAVIAFCIAYIIEEGKALKAEYNEWSTRKRREKYRKPAYKQMNKRRTMRLNREELWKEVNR